MIEEMYPNTSEVNLKYQHFKYKGMKYKTKTGIHRDR